MLSCIVTAYREAKTIAGALHALLSQDWPEEYEVLVVCPDAPTAVVVHAVAAINPQVRHVADHGEGKPAALNLALTVARGAVCILTDGDVMVQPGAITALLAPFKDLVCGAVSGRPISSNPNSTMLGYWSHLLTDAGAHGAREVRARNGHYFDCSGYLFAARRELLPTLPPDALADDAFISRAIWRQGYRIAYAPEAKVSVRYPTTYSDWLLQKVRSTAGAAMVGPTEVSSVPQVRTASPMRSFRTEAAEGIRSMLAYPRSARQHLWMLCLLAARIHLWIRVWSEVHIRRRSYREIWQRVETTK